MGEKIKIILSNFDGAGYIWNNKDKEVLQEKYRIVGKLCGEEFFNGLPFALLSEEITLLREKGIVTLYQCPSLLEHPSKGLMLKYDERQKAFVQYEKASFLKDRRKEVEQRIDSIIQGKMKKLSKQEANKMDREAMYSEEMEKIKKDADRVNPVLMDVEDVYVEKSDLIYAETNWTYPQTELEKLKYDVFKDLWERDYYLTSGANFGGDFLCYTGNPKTYHSSFIIICKLSDSLISCKDLVSQGRIGTCTRKTTVIATRSLDEDNKPCLSYQSLQWIESQRFKSLT